jgi:hypothetical protein
MTAINVPYNRQQQALQRDFQNEQFMDNRAFRNSQADWQRQQAALPAIPAGYMLNDPANPQAGVSPLPGYDPNVGQGADYTTPFQAVDENGNPVFLQADNRGNVKPVDGFRPSNPIKTIDAGTEVITVDSRTGEVISKTPKQNTQEAFDTETGKLTAKSNVDAAARLPQIESQGNQMLAVIDRLENDPNMESAMGVIQGRLPSMLASPLNAQGVENFRAIKSQLEGQAFLQAFESLKGGGQITEIEGRKATDAMAAMRDTQSPDEFRRQLSILRGVIQTGIARSRKSAQSGAPGSQNAIQVPSPMTAGATPQDAIPMSDEGAITDSMIGKYVNLNGKTFKVEAD